ncbi:AcrR family transcriptional regulator [Pseudochelatococcus lubricantis]|uniref:AcrR family transcriptional regulator n=1 Tax=Pseudochelatococcus lubricantis TaxID=1538102 RepID=A0ABX0UYU8_9HYPH|nr:TetR/AcrR family transcriptional regulator [Pseudochelatococcus lubricantis]NIJ58127.1 AcrR family transcriptional regulator [Pseudochelatococcus lubricantis]
MARHRTITRDQVLDAARAVVLRDGAGRLTLEAVARQAGISKASVLYDFKTKQQLVGALITRGVDNHCRKIEDLRERLGSASSDSCIRARIEAVRNLSEEDRAVATGLCAAMAQDITLRKPVQALYASIVASLCETSASPRGALLAFLATEGLAQLELFGFQPWQGEEWDRLLADIGWLSTQVPGGAALHHSPESSPKGVPGDKDDG